VCWACRAEDVAEGHVLLRTVGQREQEREGGGREVLDCQSAQAQGKQLSLLTVAVITRTRGEDKNDEDRWLNTEWDSG